MNGILNSLSPTGADPALLSIPSANTNRSGVDKVAKDFESMFVSMLTKQMRQTLDGESMFPGDHGDVWGGLFDMYMGQHLAQSKALGIGEMVKTQLTGGSGKRP